MTERGIPRPLRAILGVITLLILLGFLLNAMGDYRAGKRVEEARGSRLRSVPTTSTPTAGKPKPGSKPSAAETSATKPAAEKSVIVAIEGLNFRRTPSPTGDVIRGLSAGEKLTLIKKQGSWYQVRDNDDEVGWISANAKYTTLE